MSFITQCPACETQFKVTPDQLKMSEGWVRCGHCQHVFDASLNLQPWWPEPQTPAEAKPEDSEDALPDPQPSPDAVDQDGIQTRGDVPAATHEPARADETAGEYAPARTDASLDEREPVFDLPPNPDESMVSVAQPMSATVDPEPVGLDAHNPSPSEPPADTSPLQPIPSFIKRAMQKAYWHQTSVRLTLYLLITMLLMVLSAQWVYRHKDQLAANHESLRPLLVGFCGVLRCEITLPRQLSEVVIDSSSFVRREANRFDFQLMLRNRADVEVAMPTLELTLTDIENQVIARRIIDPADWPESPSSLAAQAEWPLQLELLLEVPPTQIVTGYQAELFYP